MDSTKSTAAAKSSHAGRSEQRFTDANTVTKIISASDVSHFKQRIIQNFLLLWMDPSIDPSNKDCQNTLTQLRNVANDVHIFDNSDTCVNFLRKIKGVKTFLVADSNLGQKIIPLIHDIPQLDAIYIFCRNQSQHEKWSKEWIKIKGVHTEIAPICKSIQQLLKQCDQNFIPMSFVSIDEEASSSLNQLEPSFMYTQLFKEILLGMEYNEESIKHFTAYCQRSTHGSPSNIILFKNEYNPKSAIWWYTYPSFIFALLNSALRTLEADTIINMGFFIRDLHFQIEELYKKQLDNYQGNTFIVYRGQILSVADFEKLRKTKDGLISFNNFLSTSKNREISLEFAQSDLGNNGTVGILFQMSIDPSISSAPFAAIEEISYFMAEEEILFSMHTVFRIGEINKIDNNNSLYQVELKLTADDDEQLRTLTKCVREKAGAGTGWDRLGNLLLAIGQFDKAEELYKVLFEQISDQDEKAHYYVCLGYVKNNQGDYQKAIEYYDQGLEILQKTVSSNHLLLATFYNNMGVVYRNMGKYSKALSFCEKALEIRQKTLSPNHPDLSTSYSNIGLVYDNTGEYLKALSLYKTALKIQQNTLPSNHPDLASSYNNIGSVYDNIGNYSEALSFYQQGLEIRKKTLPHNHHLLATSYNNIGGVYRNMGEYSKALSFYKTSLEIREKTLTSNHPDLASSYNNIGALYDNMREYSKALSFYKKSLEICEKSLPSNYLSFANSNSNIATIYRNMKAYGNALHYYECALNIWQLSLPSDHSLIQNVRKSIEIVKKNMKQYETIFDE